MIYFTSDMHFNHDNIITYCSRPFRSAEQMNEAIVAGWNSVVKSNDTVYILGDILMSKDADACRGFMERLSGRKILVQGNHDYFVKDYFARSFNFFEEVTMYKEINYDKHRFVLMHYPIMDWNHMYHGSYMLHGHLHNQAIYNHKNKTEGLRRYDVGVDANNFMPVSVDKIVRFFR